jgi:hypothetical protein
LSPGIAHPEIALELEGSHDSSRINVRKEHPGVLASFRVSESQKAAGIPARGLPGFRVVADNQQVRIRGGIGAKLINGCARYDGSAVEQKSGGSHRCACPAGFAHPTQHVWNERETLFFHRMYGGFYEDAHDGLN